MATPISDSLCQADGSAPVPNDSGDELTSSCTEAPLITFKLQHFLMVQLAPTLLTGGASSSQSQQKL